MYLSDPREATHLYSKARKRTTGKQMVIYKDMVCENKEGHEAVTKPRNVKQVHNVRAAQKEEVSLWQGPNNTGLHTKNDEKSPLQMF